MKQLSLIRDRDPDRDPDRAIARTHDLALTLARDLDLALDLARDRALALALAHNLDRDRDRDLDRDLAHARNLAHDLHRDIEHAYARDLDRARDLDLDRALDHALALALDRALDRARARDRDRARARARDLAHALDLDTEKVSRPSADRIGVALSKAISAYHQAASSRRKDRNPEAEFSRTILQIVSETPATVGVRADEVWDAIMTARDALARSGAILGSTVADRLLETARPIFNREQPVTAHIATIIRLPALCLAVEAEEALSAPELGVRFRELAAAITLLERYATGQQSPCETILLAYA